MFNLLISSFENKTLEDVLVPRHFWTIFNKTLENAQSVHLFKNKTCTDAPPAILKTRHRKVIWWTTSCEQSWKRHWNVYNLYAPKSRRRHQKVYDPPAPAVLNDIEQETTKCSTCTLAVLKQGIGIFWWKFSNKISNKTPESVRSACTGSFERSASGVEALFLLFLLAAVEKCLSSDPLLSHSSRF